MALVTPITPMPSVHLLRPAWCSEAARLIDEEVDSLWEVSLPAVVQAPLTHPEPPVPRSKASPWKCCIYYRARSGNRDRKSHRQGFNCTGWWTWGRLWSLLKLEMLCRSRTLYAALPLALCLWQGLHRISEKGINEGKWFDTNTAWASL